MASPDLTNAVSIPTLADGTAYYSFRIALNNVTFTFIFNYSSREECWYLDIADSDTQYLLRHIKLVPGYYLCEYQKEFRGLFAGDLMVLTATDLSRPPTLFELGENKPYQLIYVPV